MKVAIGQARIWACVVALAFAGGASHAQFYGTGPPAQPTNPEQKEPGLSIKDFAGIFTGLIWIKQRQVMSWKVADAQIAAATKAQVNSSIALAQGKVGGTATLESTAQQIDTYRQFSAVVGQGAQVCDASSQRNDIDRIGTARDQYAFANMANGGRAAYPAADYEVKRSADRLDLYCSADEHNLGLCRSRFDGMATASTSAPKVGLPDQYTHKQLKAASDYIANLVPAPVPTRGASTCDAGCQAARLAALRVEATSSMVAVPTAARLAGRIGEKTFAAKQ